MSEQEDKKIIRQLKQLPIIEDHRSDDAIYDKLAGDDRMKNQPTKKNKLPLWIVLAAALLLALLTPTLIKQFSNNEEIADQAESSEKEISHKEESSDHSTAESKDNKQPVISERTLLGKYALYEQDTTQFVPFHVGLASEDAYAVPVTLLLQKSTVDSKATANSVDLYNRYASEIDEEALGFTSYHPFDAVVTKETDEKVKLAFAKKEEVDYDHFLSGSAAIDIFGQTIAYTFPDFELADVTQEDGVSPIYFGGYSPDPVGPLELKPQGSAYYNYPYQGKNYLFPVASFEADNVVATFEEMKESPNDFQQSIVPEGIDYTVESMDGTVIVTFNETLKMTSLNDEVAYLLVEGLNAAANSFDLQLQLKNVEETKWHNFDLKQPLPRPIGINPTPFEAK